MLGAIAGDIVGSRFEGRISPPEEFDLFSSDCRFTDDTVCSLAVACAVAEQRDVAEMLRLFVRRHPNRGYGPMFLSWAFSDDAPAYGSWGNGAPMRTSAAGWLASTEEEALRYAEQQATVSHNHSDAVAASQAVSIAIFWASRGVEAANIREEIERRYCYILDPIVALEQSGFDVSAKGTTASALAAALASASWEEAVRLSISRGGDVDTLACIAGSVAEALHGVPSWVERQVAGFLTADLLSELQRLGKIIRRTETMRERQRQFANDCE